MEQLKQSYKQRPLVLVVDDYQQMNRFLCEALSFEFDVISARHAADAIDKARKYQPDVILSDLILPDISGETFIKMLKDDEDLKIIPAIAVSTIDSAKLRGILLNLGFTDYFSKPFVLKDLISSIKSVVALKPIQSISRVKVTA